MKIWRLEHASNDYESIIPVNKMTLDEWRSFDGQRKLENWVPIKVTRMEPKKGLPLGNIADFNSIMSVLDEKAIKILLPLIENDVELLPLEFDEINPLYAINVIDVIDAIDYEKSEYKTFSDGNRIMRFMKYAFREEAIAGKHIFKLIDEPKNYPFVSDTFKDAGINAGLEGFKFRLVWDSEEK